MLKKMAWNTFKNTGSIDTMMELLEVNQIEKKENMVKNINTSSIMNQDKNAN